MKKLVPIALLLLSFTPLMVHGQRYKHKSEAEIARMTPAQRVDEFAEEQARHKYDVLDEQSTLIEKYILRDGLRALPRIIQIIDGYDPTHKHGSQAVRFDAIRMLLEDLDGHVVRLRGSQEGQRAMEASERAISRMRAAGYERKEQHEWKWVPDGRFELALTYLKEAKGIGFADRAIRDTLRLDYKILLSKEELLAFGNFLVARDPSYPSWSEANYFRDYTQINEAGYPLWVRTMKKPEPFYAAYLEFKKTKAQ